MKRWFSLLLAAILCASTVACDSGGNVSNTPASIPVSSAAPSSEEAAPSALEPVTLQYYDWQLTESPAGDIVRGLIDQYMKDNPHVTIEFQAIPTAQRGEKLMTLISGNMTPDIVHINEADMANFVHTNAFEPLNNYLNADTDLKTALIPEMVNMVTYDEKTYGIPRFASINTLIYNAKHFRDAGLDPDNPPKTWDEFTAAAKALTRDTNSDGKTDRWGVGLIGAKVTSVGFRYWWSLWGAGGEILNADNTASLLASPESAEAMKFYTDLYLKEGVVPPGVTDVDYTALVNDFIAEKTSMICDGPWQIGRIMQEQPGAELRAAPMPSKPGVKSATTGGGGFLAISSSSKHKEEAWKLVQYLSNAENHWKYVNEGSFLPCRADTRDKLKAEGDPLLGQFADTLTYSRLTPNVPVMSDISLLLAEELQYVLTKEKTADQAAQSLGKRVDELLKS